jgi:hypothetical protein
VLTDARRRARSAGDPIPYFAEEALARAIGGSGGTSSRELIGASDVADATTRLRDAIRRDVDLSAKPFVTAAQFGTDLDLLGSVLRVALVHCRRSAAGVLANSIARRINTVVLRTAAILSVPPESVVVWAAHAAVTRRTVFAELDSASSARGARSDCH